MSKPETTEENTEEVKIDNEFNASIEAAVDAAIEEDKKNRPVSEKPIDNEGENDFNDTSESDLPLEGEASSEGDEGQEDDSPVTNEVMDDESENDSADEPEPISDELLERAIRAGITIRTARKFPDGEALEEAINLIKPQANTSGDETTTTDEPVEAEAEMDDIEKLLADINVDPKEFDADFVKTVNALKGVASALHKQNKELQTQASVSGFEASLASLDETATKIVRDDPSKKTALRKKFDTLKAGYKAVGDSVSDSDVFKEASEMVLSADIAKAKTQSKSAQAQKRSKQLITRPSGKSVQPSGSAEEEAAKLLKEKFNI